jgi:hypothetical protein
MVNDTPWGNGTYTADAPTVSIQTYQAYLQFFWPDTEMEFTIGLQPVSLPQSPLFYDSVIMASKKETKSTPPLVVTAPVIDDTLKLNLGFTRRLDANGQFDTSTTQRDDELDLFFLTAPLTLPGFTLTPWGMSRRREPGLSSHIRPPSFPGILHSFPGGIRTAKPALWGRGIPGHRRPGPLRHQSDAIYARPGKTTPAGIPQGHLLRHGGTIHRAVVHRPRGMGPFGPAARTQPANGSERILPSPPISACQHLSFPLQPGFSNDVLNAEPTVFHGRDTGVRLHLLRGKDDPTCDPDGLTGTSTARHCLAEGPRRNANTDHGHESGAGE